MSFETWFQWLTSKASKQKTTNYPDSHDNLRQHTMLTEGPADIGKEGVWQ